MKLKIYTLLLALCVTWSLQSCDNDDDNSIAVPTELQNAFASKYPNAANVKWETKCGYYVADFYDGYEASAWFTQDGKWQMTETDIPYNALPQAVKTSFEKSEYASWKQDDVDKLERTGVETIFVIEVENQNQEIDLYYSADGTLIKSIVDTDDDNTGHLPVQLTEATAILLRFRKKKKLHFQGLFHGLHSRSEVVATFLAVLELSKTHRIHIEGEDENPTLTLFTGEEREERIS